MARWDVSRHPEWDMMYAAGLIIREISRWWHQSYSTVHLHLQVREKYSPGLRARHEAALGERGPIIPSTKWRNKLAATVDFYRSNSRLRAASVKPVEQSMFMDLLAAARFRTRRHTPFEKDTARKAAWLGSKRASTGSRPTVEVSPERFPRLRCYSWTNAQIQELFFRT